MGNKWEVTAWLYDDYLGQWRDEQQCSTEYLLVAIWHMLKAKRNSGCVRLIWRG